jgi:hypothetical protein
MIEYLFGFDIGKFIIGAHRIALLCCFSGFIIWFYVFMFSTGYENRCREVFTVIAAECYAYKGDEDKSIT